MHARFDVLPQTVTLARIHQRRVRLTLLYERLDHMTGMLKVYILIERAMGDEESIRLIGEAVRKVTDARGLIGTIEHRPMSSTRRRAGLARLYLFGANAAAAAAVSLHERAAPRVSLRRWLIQ